ncbi:MAG: hypothetical protein WCO35_01895 [Candidatus Nomurabacteria bacterium]
MKKLLLVLCIFFSFTTAKALDFPISTDDQTYKPFGKSQKIVDERPNPITFSREEAWSILMGDITKSEIFEFQKIEYRGFHFFFKKKNWKENYSLNLTKTGWYTCVIGPNNSDWEINYSLILGIILSLLFFFISNININKKYLRIKNKKMKGFVYKNQYYLSDRICQKNNTNNIIIALIGFIIFSCVSIIFLNNFDKYGCIILIISCCILWMLSGNKMRKCSKEDLDLI